LPKLPGFLIGQLVPKKEPPSPKKAGFVDVSTENHCLKFKAIAQKVTNKSAESS
jgi:hypothetical protein